MEFCKVTLTFECVDEILWCDHSNKNSLAVLTHSAICFSQFYKMKFGNLVKIWLWRCMSGNQDGLGFYIPRCGYPDSRLLAGGTWIPDSLCWITGSISQDSGFRKQKFPRFRIRITLHRVIYESKFWRKQTEKRETENIWAPNVIRTQDPPCTRSDALTRRVLGSNPIWGSYFLCRLLIVDSLHLPLFPL